MEAGLLPLQAGALGQTGLSQHFTGRRSRSPWQKRAHTGLCPVPYRKLMAAEVTTPAPVSPVSRKWRGSILLPCPPFNTQNNQKWERGWSPLAGWERGWSARNKGGPGYVLPVSPAAGDHVWSSPWGRRGDRPLVSMYSHQCF